MTDLASLTYPLVSGSCLKAIEMIADGETDITALEKVISQDPMLSLAIIRLANSPMHRRQSEIEDVNTAVNILGLTNVMNALVMETIKTYTENGGKTSERIIQHSAVISVLCHFIADKLNKSAKPIMELLGILHDLPSLVLCHNFRPEYRELMQNITRVDQPLQEMEMDIFGFRRDEIMQHCIEDFHLPERVIAALTAYARMEPMDKVTSNSDKYVAMLRLAHYMEVKVSADDRRLHDAIADELEQVLENLELSAAEYEDMLEDCSNVVSEHISQVA